MGEPVISPEIGYLGADTQYYLYKYRIELTQIESETPGKVRISMLTRDFTPSSAIQYFAASEYRIATDAARQNVIATSVKAAYGVAAAVEIDNAYLGQTLYVSWRGMANQSTMPGDVDLSPFAAAFTLTVSKGEGVESVSVNRSASAVAEAGQIESGAIVYTGDTLDISAEAESGYKLQEFDTPVTVSGDTEINILAAVGSNTEVFDGTVWAKYQIEVYNGSEWGVYQPQVFNGSEWEQY